MRTPDVLEAGTNWAGSHTYGARGVVRPESVDELCALVVDAERVRALGSRHSFTDVADTEGYLVEVGGLPQTVEVDEDEQHAWVSAGMTYSEVAPLLDEQGWAVGAMASLPHITVAGAVATGTHGSGATVGSLASTVCALELVTADGTLRTVRRGEPDFDGCVVAIGALGVVTRVALDLTPSFRVRQDVLLGLGWEAMDRELDTLMETSYSVSIFTDWVDAERTQVWLKSRVGGDGSDGVAPDVPGLRAAREPTHMLSGGEVAGLTDQLGLAGPWHDRLPHFRAGFTPSRGAELQSEWFVPRARGRDAVAAMRVLAGRLGERLGRVLQVSELRSITGDDLWLSGTYGRDTLALHFTWLLDREPVYEVIREVEATLAPYDARPHWGKCFTQEADELAGLWPRFADFAALRDRLDPDRKFGNAFLQARLGS